jgi:hypothetical protein
MSKLDRPMPSVSLAGDTDGTEDINEITDNIDVAMRASMYYWKDNELNTLVKPDMKDSQIDKVGAIVNGTNPPNSPDDRRKFTKKAYSILIK